MIEKLKHMKHRLIECAESQMDNLYKVDTKELGEVIDMIKDLEEAMYYGSIVKAMEESEDKEKHLPYYREMPHKAKEEHPLHLEPHESATYLPSKAHEERYERPM